MPEAFVPDAALAICARDLCMTEKRRRKKRSHGAHGHSDPPIPPVYRGGQGSRPDVDPNLNKSLLDAADSDEGSPPSEGVSGPKCT